MKSVIKGKLYDTDTARELGSWSSTWDTGDFSYVREALYRKRTGEYFLHGQGGPASRYARSAGGNAWTGGEKILPLSVEVARSWAEERLDAEEYAKIFGMPDEGDGERSTLCVQLPAALVARLRQRAADEGVAMAAVISAAVERYLG